MINFKLMEFSEVKNIDNPELFNAINWYFGEVPNGLLVYPYPANRYFIFLYQNKLVVLSKVGNHYSIDLETEIVEGCEKLLQELLRLYNILSIHKGA